MGSLDHLEWISTYLRAHPIHSIFVIVSSIFEPVLYMLPLFISADIVGVLVDGGGWSEVWPLFRLLIPIIVVQVTFFFLSSYLNEILAHRITTDITYDFFDDLQNRSLSYHDAKDVGEIMARATNDTRTINMGLSPGLRILLALFSIWFVSLIVIFQLLPWYLTGIGLIALVIFVLAIFSYGQTLQPLSNQALEELSDMSSIATDSLVGIRDIKSSTSESLFKAKFAKQTTIQARTKEEEGRVGAWFYPTLIVKLYVLLITGFSLALVFQGQISIRDIVLVVTIMALVTGMSEDMNWVSFVMVGAYAAAKRLHVYLHEEDMGQFPDGNIDFSGLTASISFDSVKFSYPTRSDTVVLNDISFALNDGDTLAIVGSPGSGKSTITKLIQRLYLPSSGEIRIGGISIREFSNSSLRKGIATVEQDIRLFNDTVIENIRFGKPHATREEVIQVAKIAQAHEFITDFIDGYDTLIGEDGIKLSGGQQQRLAIARAILLDPEILIFDDSGSALDAKTELKIQQAITGILQTRTTIVTTHRLAIIAKADKVLILDKGQIVGFGSHEHLIKSNTYYRNLFSRHFELPPLEEIV